MKPLRDLFQILTKVTQSTLKNATGVRIAILLSLVTGWSANAQTVTWSDSFVYMQKPSAEQCQNWTNFLNQLGGKSFVSVRISGSFDEYGKTITDPVAANALANLLYTKTPGTVTSGANTWTVTMCGEIGACGSLSVALSVNGNQAACDCNDQYAIRPHSIDEDWGGINVTRSCEASSQTMSLEFSSGVSIVAGGPTTFCEGGSVTLTAKADYCKEPLVYEWSNGASTQSITVSTEGNYWVRVKGANACEGISSSVPVTFSKPVVNAGSDAVFCTVPVQLNAVASSTGGSVKEVNKICVYNSMENSSVEIDDCDFTTNVCTEGATFFVTGSHSTSVFFENPVELRYHVYYSAFAVGTFYFKLNGNVIGSFYDSDPKGTCETKAQGRFPRSFVFTQTEFKKHWLEGQANTLTVDIASTNKGMYLAGIIVEVLTSRENYSWSPVAGLDDPTIKNPIASPLVTTPYTVTYTDVNGCTATDEVTVTVDCSGGPVAIAKEVVVDLIENCYAVVDPVAFNNGSTGSGTLVYSASPAGPYPIGVTEILFTVTDGTGASNSSITKVTVLDKIAPIVNTPDIAVPNTPGTCAAVVTLTAPEITECQFASVTHDQLDNIFPVGETPVTWVVTDASGNVTTAIQKVIVTNADPVINSVYGSSSTVAINNLVTITTDYTDNNVSMATIDWGDLSLPQIITSPAQVFEQSHAYSQAGLYTVTVTLTDLCSKTATYAYGPITVFDNTLSVTGDGWYDSKPGWYLKDKRAAGRANFHFDASYENNSPVPVGFITFKFRAGNMDFKSSQLTSLMIMGDKAIVTGSGSLNRIPGHSILISAVDVQLSSVASSVETTMKKVKKVDKIRVRISDPSGNIIYDTQLDDAVEAVAVTDIGAGSIEINNSGGTFTQELEQAINSYFGNETTSVYPNPFVDNLNIQYNSSSTEDVAIQLLDLSGKVVASAVYPASVTGNYSLNIPAEASPGIYILTIKQGQQIEYLRALRK